uniref:Uncharacterized protein n=1 Tax=Setaria italica TaxID=4555 RepID=K4A4J8_SETIT
MHVVGKLINYVVSLQEERNRRLEICKRAPRQRKWKHVKIKNLLLVIPE